MPIDPITELQRVIGHDGTEVFERAPRLLERILLNRIWEQRLDMKGQPFPSFEAFVTHPLWQGLESTVEDLLLICRKRDDVQVLVRKELEPAATHGGDHGNQYQSLKEEKWQDNIVILPREHRENISRTDIQGNSPTYAIRRLKRDRPDIAEKVISGEMSAHAGAIEAGFRKKRTPFEEVLRLLPKLSDLERAKIYALTAPDSDLSELDPLKFQTRQ